MKMINPRSGHGPMFGPEILYVLAAVILGWPVTLPVIYLTEVLKIKWEGPFFDVVLIVSVVAGTYLHYKFWALLYAGIKELWKK